MKLLDLTHTIRTEMPVFPGGEQPAFSRVGDYEPDGFREMRLQLTTHTGTHMDAPAHVIPGGETLDRIPAERFLGRALKIDCRDLKEGEAISPERIRRYGTAAEEAEFLLFCLGWDARWGTEEYFGDYPCLDADAEALLERGGYKGIGFDGPGPDPVWDESLPRHKGLLKAGLLLIENLKDLSRCPEGPFWFGCFPLKAEGSDGAPVRAMAWWEEPDK